MKITQETAIVFKGGGRRYFTLKAACHAAARKKIRDRWRESGDDYREMDLERYARIVRTLAYFYTAAYRRQKPTLKTHKS